MNTNTNTNMDMDMDTNMDVQSLSNDHLQSRLQNLVKTERKITHLVLQCIAEIDWRKLYLQKAYPSLFEFLVQMYGYSASAAMRRIDGARLLQQIPEVAEKIENGTLNLSQVAILQRAEREVRRETKLAIPVEVKRELLEKIVHQTQAKTEQLIAQTLNREINSKNKIIQHRDESVTVTMTFSKEQMAELKHLQALVSHAVPEKNWASLVIYLAKKELGKSAQKAKHLKPFDRRKRHEHQGKSSGRVELEVLEKTDVIEKTHELEKTDVIEKTHGLETTDAHVKLKTSKVDTFTTATAVKRKHVPRFLKKHLFDKNATCVYRDPDTGKTCGSRHFLQVDHIQSVSRGGRNDLANLQVLCGQHNRYKFMLETAEPGDISIDSSL